MSRLRVHEGQRQPRTPVNLRNFSVKCGFCSEYQTLCEYSSEGQWNIYVFECDNGICDPKRSRTILEIPLELDEFAQRDPSWEHEKAAQSREG